ncbi:hypothetical protein ACHAW5_001496, partial [Stephanodiscus triporus]
GGVGRGRHVVGKARRGHRAGLDADPGGEVRSDAIELPPGRRIARRSVPFIRSRAQTRRWRQCATAPRTAGRRADPLAGRPHRTILEDGSFRGREGGRAGRIGIVATRARLDGEGAGTAAAAAGTALASSSTALCDDIHGRSAGEGRDGRQR